jgi:hypothetical protein
MISGRRGTIARKADFLRQRSDDLEQLSGPGNRHEMRHL